MLVSVVIPAKNEEENISATLENITDAFQKQNINYEIIVVNDGSSDATEAVVKRFSRQDKRVEVIKNQEPFGFGNAIRKGLQAFKGDMVIITMADSSDSPKDMIRYVRQIEKGVDCCFGTRWGGRAKVVNYPKHKLLLNRLVNGTINLMFGLRYNDTTNAFKAYRRETIKGIQPFLARHFNITVELPLKAIVRGYSFKVIPTDWYNRRKGQSSLRIQEMGSRYLFIIIYALLEKWLTGQDYKKAEIQAGRRKK